MNRKLILIMLEKIWKLPMKWFLAEQSFVFLHTSRNWFYGVLSLTSLNIEHHYSIENIPIIQFFYSLKKNKSLLVQII